MKCHSVHALFLYSTLAMLLTISVYGDSEKNVFIGINGGESEYSNFSYFEQNLSSFSSMMSKGGYQTLLLNAGGNNGQNLRYVDDYFPERDSNGHLVLGRNSIKADPATSENINGIIEQARSENPSSVVMLLRNHGSEKGMATWRSEEYLYQNIKETDQLFPPSTLVRRVNLYCFSGRAIAPLSVPKNFDEVLGQFPVNRCGFSSADVDEFATNKDGIGDFLKLERPSLEDLKDFYSVDANYFATPRLSSDYMKDSILRLACDRQNKQRSCEFARNTIDSIELICKSFEYGQDQLMLVSEKVTRNAAEYIEIYEAKFRLIDEYLEQKYPSKVQLVSSYYSKMEANLVNQKTKKPLLLISDSEKQAYEFWDERKNGIDLKNGATKGISYLWGLAKGNNQPITQIDPNELQQIYQKEGAAAASKYVIGKMANTFNNKVVDPDLKDFSDWLFTKEPIVSINGHKKAGWAILGLQRNNEQRILETQLERKNLRKVLDIERSKFVDQILRQMPNTQLKDRLDNLIKCESKPLAIKN